MRGPVVRVVDVRSVVLPTADRAVYRLISYRVPNATARREFLAKFAKGHVSIWRDGWRELCRSPRTTVAQVALLHSCVPQ